MPAVKRSRPTRLSRRARALATHRRIVKAAYMLFCERGYAGTTMADVAEAADVAVQTVYFTFHTKAALLSRTYDLAVMGEEQPVSPEEQPWYRAMAAEPDVALSLRSFVDGVGEITRRVTPLIVAARAGAAADPETAAVVARHERWRADGYREVLGILRTKARLRAGLDPERANQLLLLFVGPDAYRSLVIEHDWPHDEWADWTAAALSEQLFDVNGHARGRARRPGGPPRRGGVGPLAGHPRSARSSGHQ